MRAALSALSALAAATTIFAATAATAAPTCFDRHGDTVRCGTAGAMPVGWTPAPEVQEARLAAEAPPDNVKLIGLALFLAGLFGLFALMPDFEGKWDREAGDDERRD